MNEYFSLQPQSDRFHACRVSKNPPDSFGGDVKSMPLLAMPETPPELAVGDRLVVSDDEDPLHVVTIRSDDHLFVTTYRETADGPVRLALQVDITTGATAIDPRSFARAFWTLVVRGTPQA